MYPTRRVVVRGVAAAALAALSRPAAAATKVPESATLLAPGPEDSHVARLADRAAAALARGLVQASALRVSVLGGPDGITAANRFASTAGSDGVVLLMLPGAAVQAQFVGDSRARYEPRVWPAICGSLQTAVLAGRGALTDTAPIRVALPGPGAPETAALLALDMLGRRATPVFGLSGAAAEAAIMQGSADAMPLSGAVLASRAGALGLNCWFTFDAAGSSRDPALTQVPAFGELATDIPRGDLLSAVRAAGAAMRGRGLVVLPALTSGDVVALWRGAAQAWAEEEPEPREAGARRIAAGEATALLTTLCPRPEVALAYREWLLRRLSWHAS